MKVVIIGSGNVASHLATALHEKGVEIIQIYSRTTKNAQILAQKLDTTFTNVISEISLEADIYIYALNDNSLSSFLKKFNLPDAIHIHTAGSIPMGIFERYTNKYGVLYPFQTFSKDKKVDFTTIPICIEGINSTTENKIADFAALLSSKIYFVKSEQRKKLHLAAVFACNFSNYMYDIANELVTKAGFGIEIIQPLIIETADKINYLSPCEAQTGPAKRADQETIYRHIFMLSKYPGWKKIYKLLTSNIYKRHKKSGYAFPQIKVFRKKLVSLFSSNNK